MNKLNFLEEVVVLAVVKDAIVNAKKNNTLSKELIQCLENIKNKLESK